MDNQIKGSMKEGFPVYNAGLNKISGMVKLNPLIDYVQPYFYRGIFKFNDSTAPAAGGEGEADTAFFSLYSAMMSAGGAAYVVTFTIVWLALLIALIVSGARLMASSTAQERQQNKHILFVVLAIIVAMGATVGFVSIIFEIMA